MGGFVSFGQVIPVTGPNIGFPGTVSRFGERIITARPFLPTTTTNVLNFGAPAVEIPDGTGGHFDSVADFLAAATSNLGLLSSYFAGFAVREVKTQLGYPQTPGVSAVGYYANGQEAEVLERGSITVPLAVGAPQNGAKIYIRIALNAAVTAGVVGDIETNPAASDLFTTAMTTTIGSTTVTLGSATNTQNGQLISGSGIPAGAYIVSGGGTTTIVISSAATDTHAALSATATISNLFAVPTCVARTGNLDANNMLEVTLLNRLAA